MLQKESKFRGQNSNGTSRRIATAVLIARAKFAQKKGELRQIVKAHPGSNAEFCQNAKPDQ